MRSLKELEQIASECKKDIEALGIELGTIVRYTINTRAKSRWGQCKGVSSKGVLKGWEISISSVLMDDAVDIMALKNTVAHELLHTVGGTRGHTGLWKIYAERMNKTYGYNIKRCTSSEEKGIANDDAKVPKYIIECENCGHEYKYYRKCKMVQLCMTRPEYVRKNCRCSLCKSHRLTLKGWQVLSAK